MKFGPWEIGLILIIILIVFGVGKIPDIGRQMGKGLRDFKKYSGGAEDDGMKSAGTVPDKSSSEVELAKAKMEAAEAKLKLIDQTSKKAS